MQKLKPPEEEHHLEWTTGPAKMREKSLMGAFKVGSIHCKKAASTRVSAKAAQAMADW